MGTHDTGSVCPLEMSLGLTEVFGPFPSASGCSGAGLSLPGVPGSGIAAGGFSRRRMGAVLGGPLCTGVQGFGWNLWFDSCLSRKTGFLKKQNKRVLCKLKNEETETLHIKKYDHIPTPQRQTVGTLA